MSRASSPTRFIQILYILTLCLSTQLFYYLPIGKVLIMSSNKLSDTVFAIQNCNSLIMTHSTSQNQQIKIDALTGIGADIIFLSDLRLGNKNLSNCSNEISRLFLVNKNNSYTLYANSTSNKRGVGFLIKSSFEGTIVESKKDPGENYFLLKISLKNNFYILGSIYGPNEHDPGFFVSLYRDIKGLGDFPILLGGDFNCTYSDDKVGSNVDCFHMNDLPNIRHTTYLREMCEILELLDPFRALYPEKGATLINHSAK
jgi:hypothetical protein